jgi:hypothetical protein
MPTKFAVIPACEFTITGTALPGKRPWHCQGRECLTLENFRKARCGHEQRDR